MSDFIKTQLTEHPIFKGLSAETINNMTNCAAEKTFSRGSTLFLEGEEAHNVFLILSGTIDLSIHSHRRGAIIIQSLHPGDILGWSWLFPPFTWHFDATAREKTQTIMLDSKCILRHCDEDPALGYELMKRFSYIIQERLHATRLQLINMYG